MMKVSLCFYENPAALQEIKFWESTVSNIILDKYSKNGLISYIIEKEGYEELMLCIPMEESYYTVFKVEDIISDILIAHNRTESEISYKKTLVFGKITPEFTSFSEVLLDFYETNNHRMFIDCVERK